MKLFIAMIALASLSAFAGETKTTTSSTKNADGTMTTHQTKTTDMTAPTPTETTTKKTTTKKVQ